MRSADGTHIAYRRLGSGPAIVMVHGSIATHTAWMRVARLLCRQYTCYAMDRRGRSHSRGGASPYSIEREYEDVCAVLDAAGPGASLAGHSFGAVCALGAAAMLAASPRPVRKLVLYEPPLTSGSLIAREPRIAYAQAIADGDPDRALEIGLSKFTRRSAADIAAMRATKAWSRLRRLAASWVREMDAINALPRSFEHYGAIASPTLMLTGSLNLDHPLQGVWRALAQVLPDVRVELLTGQGHWALREASEMAARAIADFLAA